MELDVFLTRNNEESWGFELSNDPDGRLKIIKVIASSPAEEAGLKEGDVMVKIQGVDTFGLTLDIVMAVIDDVQDKMTIGVTRGLYDPVIDDQEPIYDSYEPADFDPQSEPSEVQFKIQQFTQTPTLDPNSSPTLVRPTPTLSSPLLQPEPIREPRSLTPFDDSKRYRPFSTEPVEEVPPLEDPIILNPNYRDVFSSNEEDEPNKTKFKLPMSNQYDPDGSKQKIEKKDDIIERKVIEITDDMLKYIKNLEDRKAKVVLLQKEEKQDIKIDKEDESKNTTVNKNRLKKIIKIDDEKKKEAVKFVENMRKEIELLKIEKTVTNIQEMSVKEAKTFTEKSNELKSDPVVPNIVYENIVHNEIKEISETVKTEEILVNVKSKSLNNIPDKPKSCNSETRENETKEKKKTEFLDQDFINKGQETTQYDKSINGTKTEKNNLVDEAHTEKHFLRTIECDATKGVDDESKKEPQTIISSLLEQGVKEELSKKNDNIAKCEIAYDDVEKDIHKINKAPFEEIKSIQGLNNCTKNEKVSLNRNQMNSFEQHMKSENKTVTHQEIKVAPNMSVVVEENVNKEIPQAIKNISPNTQSTKKTKQSHAMKEITTEGKENNYTTENKRKEERSAGERTSRSQAENRVYTIGLQTIPNICGVVQPNQFDLLLKTFFIHLTDVMVALSRFILTKPGISLKNQEPFDLNEENPKQFSTKYQKNEKSFTAKKDRVCEINTKKEDIKTCAKEEKTYQSYVLKESVQSKAADFEHAQHKPKEILVDNESKEEYNVVHKVIEENKKESECNNNVKEYYQEHTKKTGAKLSQLCEKNNEDLIQKMDAVINECQLKPTSDERGMRQQNRRSRSRSQIEEEVMRESDPLEWLSKVDSRRTSQEREFNSLDHYSNSFESESKRYETRRESKKLCSTGPQTANQMYIAIVESHVYTNRNAIFEDHIAKMTDNTSEQNSEYVNSSIQANESMISENVSLYKSEFEEKTAKVVKTHELPILSAKSESNLEIVELVSDTQDFSHKESRQKATAIHHSEQVLVQEMQQVIEPVNIMAKNEITAKKINSHTVMDQFSIATAQSTEVTDMIETKPFEIMCTKTDKGVISSEESANALIISEVESEMSPLSECIATKIIPNKPTLAINSQTAIQISETEVESNIYDDFHELNVDKDKVETVQSIGYISQSAVEVYEPEIVKNDFSELSINKAQEKEAIIDMAENKYAAVQISEIETTEDDYSILETPIVSTKLPKISLFEQNYAAIQISETEAITNDLKQIEINIPKPQVVHSINVIEQAALNVRQVEASNDLYDFNIPEEKTQTAKTGLVDKRSTALQINEINSLTNDFSELSIKKHQVFEITPSVEVKRRSSAVQITEIESLKDEMEQLNVTEQKSLNVSESVMEIPTIQITEAEIRQATDIAASVTAKISRVSPVRTVKTKQEEFAELTIIKHITLPPSSEAGGDISPEVEIIEVETEEDLCQLKAVQNGFARSSEIMSQNNVKATSKLTEFLEAKREMNEIRLKSEVKQESEMVKGSANSEQTISSQLKYESSNVVQMVQESNHSGEQHSEMSGRQLSSQYAKQCNSKMPKNLALQTDLSTKPNTIVEITTPTPPLSPPTPLVDEYVFRLQAPLPKSRGSTPVPPDFVQATVSHEDPHIVKKKLIPHIELSIEQKIYDPPLPTPPEDKPCPVYSKPGLKGGAAYLYSSKEEIKEIERKSSLIASAIDQTVKSIEEYKEETHIKPESKEMKQEVSKSECTSAQTIPEHNISDRIVMNGNIVDDKDFDITKVDITSSDEGKYVSEEIGEKDKDLNETLIVSNITVDENKTKAEIDVKLNLDTVTEIAKPQSIETERDQENKINQETIILETEEKNTPKIEEPKHSDEAETTIEINSEVSSSEIIIEEIKNAKEDNYSKDLESIESITGIPETEVKDISTKPPAEETKQQIIEYQNKPIEESEMKAETKKDEEKIDYLQFVKPVKFDPEAARSLRNTPVSFAQEPTDMQIMEPKLYVSETGEPLGTIQGIVDGLEKPVLDEEEAKELGKPGLPGEIVAELISGEADILREAHVMGLTRVLSSHMNRSEDEEDVTIKPVVNSLNKSEVLKALNEEIMQKKLEEKKKWTTFLQKPKRPVPRARFGYHGYVEEKETVEEPYKVVIVKQPKPKIAPDFKPENFDTGPLPWEERAVEEASLPPVEPEEPILVPEEPPEFLEAVDPLPESEIPDLEATGLPLPVLQPKEEPVIVLEEPTPTEVKEEEDLTPPAVEEAETMVPEEDNKLAEELIRSVQCMVDPNASLEQQLAQMRVQLAALAKLPGVIQQTLEMVTKQLIGLTMQGMQQSNQEHENQMNTENKEMEPEDENGEIPNGAQEEEEQTLILEETQNAETEVTKEDIPNGIEQEAAAPALSPEELERMKKEEEARLEEERKSEKQKKELIQREREARQLKQRPTPRVGKPKPMFGPLNPEDRPLILPGGRKWRRPQDAYDDQLIAEIMQARAEVIQGKAIGINFMKYEPPPVSLEHLKHSEVYKVIHNMDEAPLKRVELLGPVIAEADYRKRCRSNTPNRIPQYNNHLPQFEP